MAASNSRIKATLFCLALTLVGFMLASCAPQDAAERSFTILAINDLYRIEGVDDGTAGGLARVRALRTELEEAEGEVLVLHAGDFLFPSLLSRRYDGAQMIDVLNLLDGDAAGFDERMFITFGNHEFDQDDLDEAAKLDQRIEDSQFTWLGTDLDFVTGDDEAPVIASEHLQRSALIEIRDVRIGLFSITLDDQHPEYVERFREPEAVARQMTAELREAGAEVVVALTHQQFSLDVELLESLGPDGPDLVVGGHEHNRILECVGGAIEDGDGEEKYCVGGRLVIKADGEARTASQIRVAVSAGPPTVSYIYPELEDDAPVDPAVATRVDEWLTRHAREYCAELDRPADCLEEVLGRTNERLVGEELEIRRFETNFGNWILDQALDHFRDLGVQAAFVNSGGLRLNQDIPADSDVTLRHIEETFQFSSEMKILKITGKVLQEAVSHAITDWTGNGHWLQIAGFAFRHDPERQIADQLTLLTPEGPRPIAPDEELLVVAGDYIAGGQDGFTMLNLDMEVPYDGDLVHLRDLVEAGLKAAGEEGISPLVEGRICNTERPGPCLAVAP